MTPEKQELTERIARLYNNVNAQGKDWDAVFVFDKINQYYYTGTMQDSVFILRKDGEWAYFARRSFDRAKKESPLDHVYPMTSYRDLLQFIEPKLRNVYIDANVVTLSHLQRLEKHVKIDAMLPVDRVLQYTRSVKSAYELRMMKESGRQHKILMQSVVPSLLKEGMNEAELSAAMYKEMIALGYQGISRFAMFQIDLVGGQLGFGDNSIYPTCFDGPGGMKGMSPAIPFVGDRERTLKKGDLVFVDIGYGYNGYHTDCTQIYMFGQNPPPEVAAIHNRCRDIQIQTANLLRPGNIPSKIYAEIMGGMDEAFQENFMGFNGSCVKFLGHGVGLQVDEFPVIATGFDMPLEKNMTISLEPKKSIAGVGVVGTEDTYIVSEEGGVCITGGEREIMVV